MGCACLGQGAALAQGHVEEGELAVGDGQAHFHLVAGVQGGHRHVASHELADVHRLALHQAGEGCTDLGALKIALGLVEVGPGIFLGSPP